MRIFTSRGSETFVTRLTSSQANTLFTQIKKLLITSKDLADLIDQRPMYAHFPTLNSNIQLDDMCRPE